MCRRAVCHAGHPNGRIVDRIRLMMDELRLQVVGVRSTELRLQRLRLFCLFAHSVLRATRTLPGGASGGFLRRLVESIAIFDARVGGGQTFLDFLILKTAEAIEQARTDSYERYVQPCPFQELEDVVGVKQTLTVVAGAVCAAPEELSRIARGIFSSPEPRALDSLAYGYFSLAEAIDHIYQNHASFYITDVVDGQEVRVDAGLAVDVLESVGRAADPTTYHPLVELMASIGRLRAMHTLVMMDDEVGTSVRWACEGREGAVLGELSDARKARCLAQEGAADRSREFLQAWRQVVAEAEESSIGVVELLEQRRGLSRLGLQADGARRGHLARVMFTMKGMLTPWNLDNPHDFRDRVRMIASSAPWALKLPQAVEETLGVEFGHTRDMGQEGTVLRAHLHALIDEGSFNDAWSSCPAWLMVLTHVYPCDASYSERPAGTGRRRPCPGKRRRMDRVPMGVSFEPTCAWHAGAAGACPALRSAGVGAASAGGGTDDEDVRLSTMTLTGKRNVRAEARARGEAKQVPGKGPMTRRWGRRCHAYTSHTSQLAG
jgi:hypothetical protein